MARKAGIPPAGKHRRLTRKESTLLGVPRSWSVRHAGNGSLTLQRPWRGRVWAVDMDARTRARVTKMLMEYWGRDENARGRYLAPEQIQRIVDAAQSALQRATLPSVVRSELEWTVEYLAR